MVRGRKTGAWLEVARRGRALWEGSLDAAAVTSPTVFPARRPASRSPRPRGLLSGRTV